MSTVITKLRSDKAKMIYWRVAFGIGGILGSIFILRPHWD